MLAEIDESNRGGISVVETSLRRRVIDNSLRSSMNDGNPKFGSIHFVKLTSTGALVACTCAAAASVTLEGAVGAVGPPA
jgi:hypothetical protein